MVGILVHGARSAAANVPFPITPGIFRSGTELQGTISEPVGIEAGKKGSVQNTTLRTTNWRIVAPTSHPDKEVGWGRAL